ncbi:AAA family ATPase [Thiohalobacter sp. IOR34]|uniref:AAA family ATPase n=1 Tax=Thiohalobacter sp. IOR34 TaxID=3057176 RepID=UPI0025B19BD5|nr:AAA family ATPase [Thiohalobacter sp. IOR34]WJW75680.1 AAA family ATPase [Thiohalobacter sp. IOR34]
MKPKDETRSDYLQALGLTRAPFAEGIADSFFYADPVLMQRLDLLQHLTQFGDMLLLVCGGPGSGKSSLLHQFRLRASNSWVICQLEGSGLDSVAALERQLADGFEVSPAEGPEFARRLMLRCEALQQDARLAVLLIDDAEQVPDEVFAALLRLGGTPQESIQRLRVVCFARPELEQRLIAAGLHNPRSPLIHRLDIPAFDAQQSAAYLMYRLAIAGYSGDSPFSSTEVQAMHKAAGGRPAELNRLAQQTLSERALRLGQRRPEPGRGRSGGRRWPLLLGLGALASALGGGLWLWQQGRDLRWDELTPRNEIPLALPPADTADSAPAVADTHPPPLAVPAMEDGEAPVAMEAPLATPASAAVPAPAAPIPPPGTEHRPAAATPPSPTTPEQAVTEPPAVPPLPADSPPEPAPPAPPAPETTPEAPAETAAPAAESGPAPAATATADEAAPAPPPEDWLSQQPADHYTLQLLGVRERAAARAFIARHGLGDAAHIVASRYKGGDWYVVLYGSYPSAAEARRGAADLPAAVRKDRPWPRRFSSIPRARRGD